MRDDDGNRVGRLVGFVDIDQQRVLETWSRKVDAKAFRVRLQRALDEVSVGFRFE
jgi:hypothetical protein